MAMKTEHKHGKCETCGHWVAEYAPYIGKMVMTCELTKRNPHCKGNYEFEIKEKEYGNDT